MNVIALNDNQPLGLSRVFDAVALSREDTGWRTIHGAKVHIGKGGEIDQGPSALVGKHHSEVTPEHAPKKIGSGSLGDVHQIGNEAVKSSVDKDGIHTREGEVYEKLAGVEGVAAGRRVKDKIHTPFFKNVASIDTIPAERRKNLAPVIAKNMGRLLNAVNALSDAGYAYNDPLQVGFDESHKAHVFDFSNAGKSKEAHADNLGALSDYLHTFGLKEEADRISTVREVWQQANLEDNGFGFFYGDDDVQAHHEGMLKNLKGYQAKHAYYATNPRHVGVGGIVQSEPRKGLKVILSDKPLTDEQVQEWELTPVIHPAKKTAMALARSIALDRKFLFDPSLHPRDDKGRFAETMSDVVDTAADVLGESADGIGQTVEVLTGELRKAGASAIQAEEAAKAWIADKISEGIAQLPAWLQPAVRKAQTALVFGTKVAFASWIGCHALAEKVARANGLTEEEARRLRGILIVMDGAIVKPVGGAMLSAGIPFAVAYGASFLPPATTAYLAWSGSKYAYNRAKAAYRAVKAVARRAGLHLSRDEEAAQVLCDALKRHQFDDWYIALLSAALDETGDLGTAIMTADAAFQSQPVALSRTFTAYNLTHGRTNPTSRTNPRVFSAGSLARPEQTGQLPGGRAGTGRSGRSAAGRPVAEALRRFDAVALSLGAPVQWDESKHGRASDGRFGNVAGQHNPQQAAQGRPQATAQAKPTGQAPQGQDATQGAAQPKPESYGNHEHLTHSANPGSLDHSSKVLGKQADSKTLASLTGAPAGSKVNAFMEGGRTRIETVNKELGMSSVRYLYQDKAGHAVLKNEHIAIKKAGGGTGTKVFASQVDGARQHGIDRIEMQAVRAPETSPGAGDAMNGHYTWARMGVDGDVPPSTKDAAKGTPYAKFTRVSQFMATKEGREFWKENGDTFKGTFKITPDASSPGEKVLGEYAASKGHKANQTAQPQAAGKPKAHPAVGAIGLLGKLGRLGKMFGLSRKFDAIALSSGETWITIGSNKDAPKGEKGGVAVRIDKEGKITAGPSGMTGNHVSAPRGVKKSGSDKPRPSDAFPSDHDLRAQGKLKDEPVTKSKPAASKGDYADHHEARSHAEQLTDAGKHDEAKEAHDHAVRLEAGTHEPAKSDKGQPVAPKDAKIADTAHWLAHEMANEKHSRNRFIPAKDFAKELKALHPGATDRDVGDALRALDKSGKVRASFDEFNADAVDSISYVDMDKMRTGAPPRPSWMPALKTPGKDELSSFVADHIAEHAPKSKGGMYPIHELRKAVADKFGPDAARHDVLNDVLFKGQKSGDHRMTSISDLRDASMEKLNAGVSDGYETFHYIEPTKKAAAGKAEPAAQQASAKPSSPPPSPPPAPAAKAGTPATATIAGAAKAFYDGAAGHSDATVKAFVGKLGEGDKSDVQAAAKAMGMTFTPSESKASLLAKIEARINERGATSKRVGLIDRAAANPDSVLHPGKAKPTQQGGSHKVNDAIKASGGRLADIHKSSGMTRGETEDHIRDLIAGGHVKPKRFMGSDYQMSGQEMIHNGEVVEGVDHGGKDLPAPKSREKADPKWKQDAVGHVKAWAAKNPHIDKQFGELYDDLKKSHPNLTQGQFHDGLRELSQSGHLNLHLFSGSDHALKQHDKNNVAMLMGKEMKFYATPGNKATSLSRTFSAIALRRGGSETVTGKHGDIGHFVTIHGLPVFIADSAGHVPPRVQSKHGKRFTRTEIEKALTDTYHAEGGGWQAEHDAEIRQAGASGHPWTFHQKLPTEIKEHMAGRPELRKLFRVTDKASDAGGADVFAHHGDRYLDLAELAAGSPVRLAAEHAKGHQDPEVAFLAHVHKNLSTGNDRADKVKLDPGGLRVGDAFKVNGETFRVAEDADGYRILKAGKDYSVAIDALKSIPVDKGTFRPGGVKRYKMPVKPDDGIPFSREFSALALSQGHLFGGKSSGGTQTRMEDGYWRTVNGSKVHFDGKGNADKGNAKVVKAVSAKKPTPKPATKPAAAYTGEPAPKYEHGMSAWQTSQKEWVGLQPESYQHGMAESHQKAVEGRVKNGRPVHRAIVADYPHLVEQNEKNWEKIDREQDAKTRFAKDNGYKSLESVPQEHREALGKKWAAEKEKYLSNAKPESVAKAESPKPASGEPESDAKISPDDAIGKEVLFAVVDKSGKKRFRESVTFGFHQGVQKNLERHVEGIKTKNRNYAKMDADPATTRLAVFLDGKEVDYSPTSDADVTDEELLASLGLSRSFSALALSQGRFNFDPNQPRDAEGRWTDTGRQRHLFEAKDLAGSQPHRPMNWRERKDARRERYKAQKAAHADAAFEQYKASKSGMSPNLYGQQQVDSSGIGQQGRMFDAKALTEKPSAGGAANASDPKHTAEMFADPADEQNRIDAELESMLGRDAFIDDPEVTLDASDNIVAKDPNVKPVLGGWVDTSKLSASQKQAIKDHAAKSKMLGEQATVKNAADRKAHKEASAKTQKRIWDNMNAAWDAGKTVVIPSMMRARMIPPDARHSVRFHNGEIQVGQGKHWGTVGLTSQDGTPVGELAALAATVEGYAKPVDPLADLDMDMMGFVGTEAPKGTGRDPALQAQIDESGVSPHAKNAKTKYERDSAATHAKAQSVNAINAEIADLQAKKDAIVSGRPKPRTPLDELRALAAKPVSVDAVRESLGDPVESRLKRTRASAGVTYDQLDDHTVRVRWSPGTTGQNDAMDDNGQIEKHRRRLVADGYTVTPDPEHKFGLIVQLGTKQPRPKLDVSTATAFHDSRRRVMSQYLSRAFSAKDLGVRVAGEDVQASTLLSRSDWDVLSFSCSPATGKDWPSLGRTSEILGEPVYYVWKQILTPGQIHHGNPKIGTFRLSHEDIRAIHQNTEGWRKNEGGKPHIPYKHRPYSESDNLGFVVETKVDADGSLWGLHQLVGNDAKLKAARNGTSVNIVRNFKSASGRVYPIILEHNCFCPDPVLTNLKDAEFAN